MEKKYSRWVTSNKGLGAAINDNGRKIQESYQSRTCRYGTRSDFFVQPSFKQDKRLSWQKGRILDKKYSSGTCQFSGDNKDVTPEKLVEQKKDVKELKKKNKKINMNHLLNFTCTPYENLHFNDFNKTAYSRNQRNKYQKGQFLQANCQFVICNERDYICYVLDPDSIMDWEFVEQVLLCGSESPLCPICLYEPTAAKITQCGHIFCYPCILHYLALESSSHRSCPLCYEQFTQADLKSVLYFTTSKVKIGCILKLQLMKRERDSMIAYPITYTDGSLKIPVSLTNPYRTNIYSKLLLATHEDIIQHVVIHEEIALREKLKEEQEPTEVYFIEQALECLSQRKLSLTHKIAVSDVESSCADVTSGKSEIKISETDPSLESNKFRDFYFYQAVDGQHIYLHGLNVKMLIEEYGSLAKAPHHLEGYVLEMESAIMDAMLRKKLRFLSHIPLSCYFELAELQLEPPVISQVVLNHFQESLADRRLKRLRRKQYEERRERNLCIRNSMVPNMILDFPQQLQCGNASSVSEVSEQEQDGNDDNESDEDTELQINACSISFAEVLDIFTFIYLFFPQMLKVGSRTAPKSFTSVPLTKDTYNELPYSGVLFGDIMAAALEKASRAPKNGEKKSRKKRK